MKIKPEMIEARLQPFLRHMPTFYVKQTWRAKRPKTVVSHDLENPPQPPTTNSLKFVVKATKSEAGCFEAGTFVKTLCRM